MLVLAVRRGEWLFGVEYFVLVGVTDEKPFCLAGRSCQHCATAALQATFQVCCGISLVAFVFRLRL